MADRARMTMSAIVRGGGRLSAPAEAGRGGSADQAVAKPFVKWAGGKRSLISEIDRHIPDKINNYWEPFVGGGAVFFHLYDRILGKAFLSDINRELIVTYQVIKSTPGKLITVLNHHKAKHCTEHYNKVRNESYEYYIEKFGIKEARIYTAGRLIYLNKTCFNGLYRVNRSGDFNVPMGRYKNPKICDEENIKAVSKILKRKTNTSIKRRVFEKIDPKSGDLVYCDPPYDGTFTGYTGSGFDWNDQNRLHKKCKEWCSLGVRVIISNNSTNDIRDLYKNDFIAEPIKASRYINCNGAGRGKVTELIIIGEIEK